MSWKKLAEEAIAKSADADMNRLLAQAETLNERERSERLRHLALEAIDLMRRLIRSSDVRAAPGIYFLLTDDGTVVYVGKSENVLLRMAGHKKKTFTSVRMIEVSEAEDRDALEKRFIHILRPTLNVSMTAFNHTHELLAPPDGFELAQSKLSIGASGAP